MIQNNQNNKSVGAVFWAVSTIALLWFLMDASAFFMRVFMSEEILLAMPESQSLHFQDMPNWVDTVFAIEVFGGILGCLCLLFRKKRALPLFVISLAGVLLQTIYVYFLSDAISIMGTPAIVMPLVAIVIAIGLIIFSSTSISKGRLK